MMELHSLPDQVYILDDNAFFNDMRLGKKERKRLNANTVLKKSLSFCLPGTKLSVDFFNDQVGQKISMCVLHGTEQFSRHFYWHQLKHVHYLIE